MLPFDEVVRNRRSVRGFSDRSLPLALIQEALSLARESPSNCNAQPWQVTIATGACRDRLRQRLLAAFDRGEPPQESSTPSFTLAQRARQVACAVELYRHMDIARHDKPGRQRAERRNFELFDAPCVAIVCMREDFGVGVALDVGCWVQTFMLALASRGIGSCAQASLRRYSEIVKEELGIAHDLRILCGISFGYEDPDALANRARMDRVPIEESCTLLGFVEGWLNASA